MDERVMPVLDTCPGREASSDQFRWVELLQQMDTVGIDRNDVQNVKRSRRSPLFPAPPAAARNKHAYIDRNLTVCGRESRALRQ